MKAPLFARLAVLALSASACSLLTSLDGYTGGAELAAPADSGGDTDATVAPEASPDAGVDAPTDAELPNLHPNGTFEMTTDPWFGFQGLPVALDGTAHGGSKSLRVCTAPSTTDYFTADDKGAIPQPTVGATYHATAWIRTAPNAAVPPNAQFFLRTIDMTPAFATIEMVSGPTVSIDGSWMMLDLTLKVTKPAQFLNVFVGAAHTANACFLLDDVRVERLN